MSEAAEASLYVDGGARGNPGPAASVYLIKSADGRTLRSEGHFIDHATNNVAEYVALVRGLEAAKDLGIKELSIFSDSELMVKQIIGEYKVKNPDLKDLHEQAQMVLLAFDRWRIRHVSRDSNREADRLVNLTIDKALADLGLPAGDESETVADRAEVFPLAETGHVSVKVMVEVATQPAQGGCPAGLQRGQCFAFGALCPPGMCLDAMQSVLPKVLALQADPTEKGRVVRCQRPGCGAVFRLSVVS